MGEKIFTAPSQGGEESEEEAEDDRLVKVFKGIFQILFLDS
jgi:hypothetical protein